MIGGSTALLSAVGANGGAALVETGASGMIAGVEALVSGAEAAGEGTDAAEGVVVGVEGGVGSAFMGWGAVCGKAAKECAARARNDMKIRMNDAHVMVL